MGKTKCLICGKDNGRNKYCCCMACYSEYRRHYRVCVVCGKSFPCPPTDDSICCSKQCSRERRAAESGESTKRLLVGREKMKALPYCQPDENYHHAKRWTLQAPDGAVYECRNLLHWLREHPDLVGDDPLKAFRGFTVIKATMTGQRKKNRCFSWRGWRLLSFEQ